MRPAFPTSRSTASSSRRAPVSSPTASSASVRKARTRIARASGIGNAAAAQIEELVRIELADRRAVAALHVVGEDLELRLAVDLGLRRQQQRLVHLIAVGLLRAARDLDLALKHAARPAGQDVLHRLPRGAVRRVVRDDGGEVGVLHAAQQLRAVQMQSAPGAGQARMDLGAAITRRRGSARNCHRCRVRRLAHRASTDGRRLRFVLQPHMGQHGILAHLRSRRPDCADSSRRRTTFRPASGARLAQPDHMARMESDRAARRIRADADKLHEPGIRRPRARR